MGCSFSHPVPIIPADGPEQAVESVGRDGLHPLSVPGDELRGHKVEKVKTSLSAKGEPVPPIQVEASMESSTCIRAMACHLAGSQIRCVLSALQVASRSVPGATAAVLTG